MVTMVKTFLLGKTSPVEYIIDVYLQNVRVGCIMNESY